MAYTTINKSTDYFNTKLYTGNGGTQSITGVGFTPSFTWIKGRTSQEYDHQLYDAVRGVTKAIASNSGDAEATESTSLTSFDSDGFSLGSFGRTNSSGHNKASWNWKANGQGSANTAGSINTTYTSANTTSGFSICQWTGTQSTGTIAHGLNRVPKIYFVKNLDTTDSWNVFAKTGYMDENYRLLLDTTGVRISDSDAWNSQVPTSSLFTVGSNTGTNKSGSSLIAYVFAEVKGFSKFGEYIGNGNADGAFIYTGFKPAMVILKRVSGSAGDWLIFDNKRNPFNGVDERLYPNGNYAEENSTTTVVDFVSNGFKLKGLNSNAWNTSSNYYIYMAFAEAPLVGSNNVPCTAR